MALPCPLLSARSPPSSRVLLAGAHTGRPPCWACPRRSPGCPCEPSGGGTAAGARGRHSQHPKCTGSGHVAPRTCWGQRWACLEGGAVCRDRKERSSEATVQRALGLLPGRLGPRFGMQAGATCSLRGPRGPGEQPRGHRGHAAQHAQGQVPSPAPRKERKKNGQDRECSQPSRLCGLLQAATTQKPSPPKSCCKGRGGTKQHQLALAMADTFCVSG